MALCRDYNIEPDLGRSLLCTALYANESCCQHGKSCSCYRSSTGKPLGPVPQLGWVSDNATDLSTLYTTPPEPSSLWSSLSRQPIRLTRTRQLAHRPAPSPTAVKQISWWPQANQPYSSSP
jgi:hypothetical protein